MSVRGVTLPSPPDGDSNQQPVLRHAVVVPDHSFRQVSAWVAVTPPMPCQRNLNLCGSQRSSSESRRPLDVRYIGCSLRNVMGTFIRMSESCEGIKAAVSGQLLSQHTAHILIRDRI
jgi:hypothetical protein